MQALYDFGTAQAFFSSVVRYSRPEIGGLASGSIFSPHQAVLDMELAKEFNELAYGFEVSDEAVGVDEIVAGRFESAHHMSSEHTLRHMQDGISFSDFLFRGLPAGAQHDKNNTQTDELLQKAADSVKTATEKGKEMAPDTELGAELYEFVKRAADELGIKTPPIV